MADEEAHLTSRERSRSRDRGDDVYDNGGSRDDYGSREHDGDTNDRDREKDRYEDSGRGGRRDRDDHSNDGYDEREGRRNDNNGGPEVTNLYVTNLNFQVQHY